MINGHAQRQELEAGLYPAVKADPPLREVRDSTTRGPRNLISQICLETAVFHSVSLRTFQSILRVVTDSD